MDSKVVMNILSRLPIRSLFRFRCVSKSFCTIIDSPCFIRLYLSQAIQATTIPQRYILTNNNKNNKTIPLIVRYSYSPSNSNQYMLETIAPTGLKITTHFDCSWYDYSPIFEIVGSCNGFVCLSETVKYDPICVCNPLTGEYMRLPLSPQQSQGYIISGFGYDAAKGEYKVVRIVATLYGHYYKREAEILTLRPDLDPNIWRRIGDSPVDICYNHRYTDVLVNGVLHWAPGRDVLVQGVIHRQSTMEDMCGLSIVALDMNTEKFHGVPTPDIDLGGANCWCIFNFKGRLALCISYRRAWGIDIWEMTDYNVKDSWTMRAAMIGESFIHRYEGFLASLFEFEEILLRLALQQDCCPYQPCDYEGNSCLGKAGKVANHVGSFVSLRDAIGGKGGKISAGEEKWMAQLSQLLK